MQIRRRSVLRARQRENNHHCEKCECCRLAQARAGLNATIVQPRKHDRQSEAEQHVRQINRIASQSIKLDCVQPREMVSADAAGGEGFKWACQKVAEKHHPAGGETYDWRKESRNVSCFTGCIRYR